jgi:hypothetical protein
MSRYHVDNRILGTGTQQNLSTTYKTLTAVLTPTSATRRGRCVALAVGADGAPNATDCQIIYAVQRVSSSAGTGGSVTPNPIFPSDVATAAISVTNYSTEGTYSLPIWIRALNQRASMQWVAQDTDAMLLWTQSTGVGLALMALSPTYAAPALGGVDYEDQ